MNEDKMRMMEMIGEVTREEMLENRKLNEEGMGNLLTRSIQAEAQLLEAFLEMIRKIQGLKFMIQPMMNPPFVTDEMDNERELMSSKIAMSATRQKLKQIVDEKMPILHKIIEEVFGPSEKKCDHDDPKYKEDSHSGKEEKEEEESKEDKQYEPDDRRFREE